MAQERNGNEKRKESLNNPAPKRTKLAQDDIKKFLINQKTNPHTELLHQPNSQFNYTISRKDDQEQTQQLHDSQSETEFGTCMEPHTDSTMLKEHEQQLPSQDLTLVPTQQTAWKPCPNITINITSLPSENSTPNNIFQTNNCTRSSQLPHTLVLVKEKNPLLKETDRDSDAKHSPRCNSDWEQLLQLWTEVDRLVQAKIAHDKEGPPAEYQPDGKLLEELEMRLNQHLVKPPPCQQDDCAKDRQELEKVTAKNIQQLKPPKPTGQEQESSQRKEQE